MRHFPCTLTSRRLPCTLTSRRLPCTLTSRRLPCTLTSLSAGTFISYASFPMHADQPAPFERTRCTLTSLSAGTFISYASFPRPLSDEQELSPGRDLVHADQPSTACRADLVSAGSFN
ncbi:hypothetical protein DPMN_081568 [Dreissena polymorpha]|uniref:Uncharacterized protein n=1 Tax=Dreissena polymorpha TaxID=45954 RepID=A0A9D3Y991_DREPO|nr:hypothetical protein DPMN_081568 [Dreissena polymorpha]